VIQSEKNQKEDFSF